MCISWFGWRKHCKWAKQLFSSAFLCLGSKRINQRKAGNNYVLLLLPLLSRLCNHLSCHDLSVFSELLSGTWVSLELIPCLRGFLVYVNTQECLPSYSAMNGCIESAVERLISEKCSLIYPLFSLFFFWPSMCHHLYVFWLVEYTEKWHFKCLYLLIRPCFLRNILAIFYQRINKMKDRGRERERGFHFKVSLLKFTAC